MPIYEYRCRDCGKTLEALRRMGQGPEGLNCASCGGANLVQKLSVFATTSSASSSPGGPAPCGAPHRCPPGGCHH